LDVRGIILLWRLNLTKLVVKRGCTTSKQ
jgi:hypothetical protein